MKQNNQEKHKVSRHKNTGIFVQLVGVSAENKLFIYLRG